MHGPRHTIVAILRHACPQVGSISEWLRGAVQIRVGDKTYALGKEATTGVLATLRDRCCEVAAVRPSSRSAAEAAVQPLSHCQLFLKMSSVV